MPVHNVFKNDKFFLDRSFHRNDEYMEVKTLAKVEVSVLSILEKIKDNGGQTAVFTQTLIPSGDLSFQVSAMSDGNNEPDQEEHNEDTEHEAMVKVNILIHPEKGSKRSSMILGGKKKRRKLKTRVEEYLSMCVRKFSFYITISASMFV